MSSVTNASKFLRITIAVLVFSRESSPWSRKNVFITVAICDRRKEGLGFSPRLKTLSMIVFQQVGIKKELPLRLAGKYFDTSDGASEGPPQLSSRMCVNDAGRRRFPEKSLI